MLTVKIKARSAFYHNRICLNATLLFLVARLLTLLAPISWDPISLASLVYPPTENGPILEVFYESLTVVFQNITLIKRLMKTEQSAVYLNLRMCIGYSEPSLVV